MEHKWKTASCFQLTSARWRHRMRIVACRLATSIGLATTSASCITTTTRRGPTRLYPPSPTCSSSSSAKCSTSKLRSATPDRSSFTAGHPDTRHSTHCSLLIPACSCLAHCADGIQQLSCACVALNCCALSSLTLQFFLYKLLVTHRYTHLTALCPGLLG